MGTRGLYGFRVDGNDYLTYNHYDSYPRWLGVEVAKAVIRLRQDVDWDDVRQRVRKLHAIDTDVPPTAAEIEAFAPYTDLSVGNQDTSDWYCLTRKAQGDLLVPLETSYIKLDNEFIKDSLFCEWAYIVNLDTLKLEVWEGFQKRTSKANRYGTAVRNGYGPCRLKYEFDLDTVEEANLAALSE